MPAQAVVGAGIGGLAVAAALLRRDVKVTVFEQAPELGEVGAGIMLTPNASRCLDDLGVLEEVIADAVAPRWTQVRDAHSGEVLSVTRVSGSDGGPTASPFLYVHRADIHTALLNLVLRLDASCIRLGHRGRHCARPLLEWGHRYRGVSPALGRRPRAAHCLGPAALAQGAACLPG